jgi:thioredoxin 1
MKFQNLVLIESIEDWNQHVIHHKTHNNILVIVFSADYCGPCKALAPKLNALAQTYNNSELDVDFIKVDIEKLENVASNYNISSIPTIMVSYNTKVVAKIVGANITDIKMAIDHIIHNEPHSK